MSVSVVKSGPYFSSGEIRFSELRNRFKETSSGSVNARELLRNTDVREANPVVPDSTENENITSSTGSPWRASQFRNSVKRYSATQSGTDDNNSYPNEPGFRMGRLDSSGRGIDWSGGGFGGRDGQGGGTTGNLTKNVQKTILITGTCGSSRSGLAAAQLAPVVQVHNVFIDISGRILGYGGEGGTVQNGNAEDGAVALNLGNIGYNNRVNIRSGAQIYGGGGGGEKGKLGDNGTNGSCIDRVSVTDCRSSGCPSCPGGYRNVGCRRGGGCHRKQVCNWWGNCWRETDRWNYTRDCEKRYTTLGGIGGEGGDGGRGQGYNNQGGPSGGQQGTAGTSGQNCFDGGRADPRATNGERGGRGGDGGPWGTRGNGTLAPGFPGRGGAAINKDGSNTYSLTGTVNGNTIKGSTNL